MRRRKHKPAFVEPRSRSPSKSKSSPPDEAAGAGGWTGAGVGSGSALPPSKSKSVSDCRIKIKQKNNSIRHVTWCKDVTFRGFNGNHKSYRLFWRFLLNHNCCNNEKKEASQRSIITFPCIIKLSVWKAKMPRLVS